MVRYNGEKKANEICLVEIFSSLSGETYNSAFPAVFVRTMGCNLRCRYGSQVSKEEDSDLNGFCDTPESYSWQNFKKMYPNKSPLWMTAKEIFDFVENIEYDWYRKTLILTGGECCMEENRDFLISEFLPLFVRTYDVSLETNGSIDYTPYVKAFPPAKILPDGTRKGLSIVADWKLPSSGMFGRMVPNNLKIYRKTDILKLVVADIPGDWKEVEELVLAKTKAMVYLSPMYGRMDPKKLWEYCLEKAHCNVRFQIQLHKAVYESTEKKV